MIVHTSTMPKGKPPKGCEPRVIQTVRGVLWIEGCGYVQQIITVYGFRPKGAA